MGKLTLLVGLPGSGKSTYAKKYLEKDNIILSSDVIRGEIFNDENDQSNNALVFSTLYSRAKQILESGKNVVIDATNCSKFDRKRVLDNFSDMPLIRVAIVIKTPIDECEKRDKERNRTVGRQVIDKFNTKFEMPTKDEGFDEIIIISN